MHDGGKALVTSAQLEARLAVLSATVADPVAGLFGPDSTMWRVNRHAALFLGGGRAALLQVAHPQVAQAIAHHSRTRTDPYGRFQRTFAQVFPMVWGSLEQALGAARAVHRVHQGIHGSFDEDVGFYHRGDRYDALDREALTWVHATLWETSILMYELLVAPLEPAAKERYYRETRRFAALFGLATDELPQDWGEFLDYNRAMWSSDRLAVGSAGREIAHYLFAPSHRMLDPAACWLRTLTAGLLPESLREPFGLRFEARERRAFDRELRIARALLPRLPRRLRWVPPYFEAQRRLHGAGGADRLGRLLGRLYLGDLATHDRAADRA